MHRLVFKPSTYLLWPSVSLRKHEKSCNAFNYTSHLIQLEVKGSVSKVYLLRKVNSCTTNQIGDLANKLTTVGSNI